MATFRGCLSVSLIGVLLLVGCQNAEQQARYVKAPFESGDLTTREAVNDALDEARTRLLSVRDDELRMQLSGEIDRMYQRAMAPLREAEQAEVTRKEQEAAKALEAERQRAEAAAATERERERTRKLLVQQQAKPQHKRPPDRAEQREKALATYAERNKNVVTDLEVGLRDSLFADGSRVLVMRNPKSDPANFQLRCHRQNAQRTFSVSIPPQREQHIGFLQGWCGNFREGDWCEAYVDGERLWEYRVPAR